MGDCSIEGETVLRTVSELWQECLAGEIFVEGEKDPYEEHVCSD